MSGGRGHRKRSDETVSFELQNEVIWAGERGKHNDYLLAMQKYGQGRTQHRQRRTNHQVYQVEIGRPSLRY